VTDDGQRVVEYAAPGAGASPKEWGSMARGFIGGLVALVLAAIVAVLWNSHSNGRPIRALGGANSAS